MTKYLSLILATSFTTTTSIASPLINNHIVEKVISALTTNRPFYQNINSTFSNYSADVHQQCAYAMIAIQVVKVQFLIEVSMLTVEMNLKVIIMV